jgi:hypothetical protein
LYLLTEYFHCRERKTETLFKYAEEILPLIYESDSSEEELELKRENPHLCVSSFPTYHKVCMMQLVGALASVTRDSGHLLEDIQTLANCLQKFIGFTRVNETKAVLHSCLVYGKQFFEMFLKRAMPILDESFSFQEHEAVLKILQSLQKSTRNLQVRRSFNNDYRYYVDILK